MKSNPYDDDVREFVQRHSGFFLVISNDSFFNRNIHNALTRHLAIEEDCLQTLPTLENVSKEIKLLQAKKHKLFLFIEREIGGHDTADLIRYIRSDHNNELYVVVLTTEVARDKLVFLHELGADNIITKPISPSTLIEKIAFTVKPRGQLGELMDKGRQLLDIGKPLEAAQVAKQVLELKPNSPSGLLLVGDALRAMGQKNKALRAYSQAEKGAKLFLEPLKKIAALYRDEGDTAAEVKFLERLDKLSPLNVDRKVELGAGYIKLRDTERAKATFDQAVRLATQDAIDAINDVTQAIAARCMENDPGLAEHYLRRILTARQNKLDRSDIETFNRLGLMLRRQGKWQEAIEEYQKALKVSPQDPGLFYNLAMAHTEGRQFVESYQFLERALSINPDLWRSSESVCYNIATIYRRYDKRDLAVEYLQKALELEPDFEKAQMMLEELRTTD